MKKATFPIRRWTSRNSTFWGIYVPASLNASGKRGYYYYANKLEAQEARARFLALSRGESVASLSPAEDADARRALEMLRAAGLDTSLEEAVATALPHLHASGASLTPEELFCEFAQLKHEGWSALSRRNFAYLSKRFASGFEGVPLARLTARSIQQWLADSFPSAGSRAHAIRTIRPAFSYAMRQGYIPTSPFERLEHERVQRANAIDIYTPEEARSLLEAAPVDCRAAYAILLFAGVRPTELTRLTWGDIRDNFIHIRPGVAKTAQVRNIDIESNLQTFLDAAERGADDTPICPPNWHRKDAETRRKAGLQGRPDAAHHSYASYYLARTPDVDTLKSNMGHSRNSDTLFAHYRAAATKEAAAMYWSIAPKQQSEG